MKARIFRVFKDTEHKIRYTHVSPPKCHDDVESVDHRTHIIPMMDIRLFNDDGSLDKNNICTYASPDVIKAYTGFDMFDADYMFSIENRNTGVIEIEFEWVEEVYPYLNIYDSCDSLIANNRGHSSVKWYEWHDSSSSRSPRSDFILSNKVKLPKISKIEDIPQNF